MSSKHGSHWLERQDFGAVTVVRLKPPRIVDDDTTQAVFDPIYSLVDDVGRKQLVLNLAAVQYLPSMALGKLVMLNRKVQAGNGRLALCHLSPAVGDSLESASLTPLFNIYATEQEAVQSFP
jgi:anti-sigma B factor antagonist